MLLLMRLTSLITDVLKLQAFADVIDDDQKLVIQIQADRVLDQFRTPSLVDM